MKINDTVYHACDIDILEFKVIQIIHEENNTFYKVKAINNVGACGCIEILLHIDKNNIIRFYDFVSDCAHIKGLYSFVDGFYYTDKDQAKKDFYEKQELLAYNKMKEHERLFTEAKNNYDKIVKILNMVK